ncbi:MAG: PAS domain-containing sensor histidine kinase, partial [Pseudomonadota bacterium]
MTIERVLHLAAVGMLLAGPILAVLTWLAFAASSPVQMTNLAQRMVLLVDLLFMLCLAAMLMWRVGVAVMARRGRSVGTQLHLRLAGIFAIAALVPTLIVAVFAALTLDVWLESLFSDRIGSVLRNSLSTAEAYEQEHRDTLKSESVAMAADIRREAQRGLTQVGLNTLIEQQAKLRNMHQAYVFNIDKAIIARGEFSYLFNFEPPTDAHLAEAQQSGDVVLISDPDGDEIRALVFLGQLGAYLYVSRFAQGDVLRLLDQTSQTVEFYDNLEATRRNLMFEWAAWYMAVALIVVMTAIMAGFWFAERLAKPVGRLAG